VFVLEDELAAGADDAAAAGAGVVLGVVADFSLLFSPEVALALSVDEDVWRESLR
jgi:hypothetical protein